MDADPSDWGQWVLEHIQDERNHPMLEAALLQNIPSEHQASLRSAFLGYSKALSRNNARLPENVTGYVQDQLRTVAHLEQNLRSWLADQQPELTTNMYYAGAQSLRSLKAAMEQLCWVAERLTGDYDHNGLEYHEMTRLCISDATCALNLCEYWIDIMVGYVQDLNAEVVDVMTVETKDLIGRIDSASRNADLEIKKQTALLEAKQQESEALGKSLDTLRECLRDLNGKRGDCLGDSDSLLNNIRNAENQIERMERQLYDSWDAIRDCRHELGSLEASTRVVSGLRDDMGRMKDQDHALRRTMADFKVKLSDYSTHISRLHHVEEAILGNTDWKDGAALWLMNAAKQSLFCFPMIPYAAKIAKVLLEGYNGKEEVPQSVKDVADEITTAIRNLHEPFPLPLPEDK